MPKDKASEAEWRKRFMLTKFGSGGGACFECSDYEAMYEDLLEFIRQQRKQAAEEAIKAVTPDKTPFDEYETEKQAMYRYQQDNFRSVVIRKGEEHLKTL